MGHGSDGSVGHGSLPLTHCLLWDRLQYTVPLSSARSVITASSFGPSCHYLRAVGRKVLWSSACVCLCVCVSVCAHCVCPQDISRTGSWITTKFGGWEQGVNL